MCVQAVRFDRSTVGPSRCYPQRGRLFFTAVAACSFWLLASVGGTSACAAAEQGESAQAATANKPAEFDVSWCPSAIEALIVVRPAALLEAAELRSVAATVNQYLPVLEAAGWGTADLDAVALAWAGIDFAAGPPQPSFTLLRSVRPHHWLQAADRLLPRTVTVQAGGREYLKSTHSVGPYAGTCVAVLDERTLLFCRDERAMQAALDAGEKGAAPSWAAAWQEHAAAELAGMLVLEPLRRVLPEPPPQADQKLLQRFLDDAHRVAEEADRAFLSLHRQQHGVKAVLYASQPEGVERLEQALSRLLELAATSVQQALQAPAGAQGGVPLDALPLLDLYNSLLKNGTLVRGPDHVAWQSELVPGALEVLAESFVSSRQAARWAELRHASVINLKVLGISLHNYHDAYKHLPAPVLLGKDKKTEYSWRVAMLPYLEGGGPLYETYRMDEPWNSQANQKILARRPKNLGAGDVQSNFSDYYVLTGPDTLFPGRQGLRYTDVTDGVSNTLMIVEARHEIPWTKPEDLPYAADKPIPKLGGIFPQGFHILFVDGSVRFVSHDVDQRVLRALITPAAGDTLEP